LGLAICRELAELMGGSIDVVSEIGVGSEFTVQIPIQIDNTESVTAPSDSRHSSKSKEPKPTTPISQDSDTPIRILVAEDGVINQEVIVGMLEMNGYEVVVANDGEEALQKSTEGSFSLCLMDVDMPKMDGIEATRMIRANAMKFDRDPLPIIAMTAHCGDQIWAECEAAGMNAYIPKPIDPETLFENIQRFQLGRNPAEAVSTP
jgi:CheY-like chemotaxis protein